MPKISIIIPVYNTGKYLSECLNSLISQTLADIEIICIDDGSTDNSLEILKEFQKKDKRIIVLINDKNMGLATSRNNALKIAKGKYIQFVDSDDWLNRNACGLIYNKMEHFNLDMLMMAGTNFDDISGELEYSPWYQFTYLPEDFNTDTFDYTKYPDMAVRLPVMTPLTVYKNKFIKKNDILFPDGLCYEDNVFFTKSFLNAKKFGILKDTLYYRRIHSSSITQNRDKNFNDRVAVSIILTDLILSMNLKNKHLFYKIYMDNELRTITYSYNLFDSKTREHYKPIYLKTVNYLKKLRECYCTEENKKSSSIKDVNIYKKRTEDIFNQLKSIKYQVDLQKQKTDLLELRNKFIKE